MTHCININHPDYIDLLNESGLHEDILKAKIAVWMKENSTDKIPTFDELGGKTEVVNTPEDYVSTTNIKKSSNINQVSDNLKDFLSSYNNYTIAQKDNSFVIMSKG